MDFFVLKLSYIKKLYINIKTMIELEEIKNKIISIKELEDYQIFLFWSRVKWDYKQYSDYDIGFLWDNKLELTKYLNAKRQIESLPYNIDLIDFNRASKEFKNLALKNIVLWKEKKLNTN